MSVGRVFNHIGVRQSKVALNWTVGTGDQQDVLGGTFSAAPLGSYGTAIASLTPFAVKALEFPAKYADGMKATGVVLKWPKGELHAQIVCQKELANGRVFNFNTPNLKGAGEPSEAGLLPKGAREAIELLIDEAEKYLKGERLQAELGLGAKGDGKAAAKPAAAKKGAIASK